ncbi:MAG TPA: RNA 2',3'-cyclic phosphodiesterase [Thermoplasmatales archaeon]|nr:RNA 2',3'-cyclic phosphodiesterase [Thermoplasmatales archaeon]
MADFRGFIAVDIDCFQSILEFMENLKRVPARLKIVEPENIHLTLKFLGNTGEEMLSEIEEIMKEAVKDISPFTMNVENVGVFPSESYIKIIWIGTENKRELISIADRLNEMLQSLGYKREKREFSPHITVARVKRTIDKKILLSLLKEYKGKHFGELKVDSIKLKKSVLTPSGAIYSTLKEVKLG